ncbi:hypothetical protein CO230_07580 [Chryseobacterium sp. 6424]|uniref:hypothetical protein n=1 Tax=Chryseobacterium sp. 6424 TaxID=2039166 RepID=UPI000EFC387C|nr:hypothetical protein [Chryseobacterium sp. 6424]AYO57996.1 hypothetical protein CO230_07580 [Chryseobacterium sp. 6424]
MKRILQLLFFIFYFLTSAQNISIVVRDNLKNSVENVNVQLQRESNTIDFKRTDKNGKCVFSIAEKGNYTLKFTSMQFKTKVVEINTYVDTDFSFILEPQITEIETVEIKARPKIAKSKEDTISYNLKTVKDGTERTAEDLIKKLPGLDINDNGKVTFKGNAIGQVLIDGNEFFGKNHKLATQNITADMLEGVDLWQNYTTVSGSQSTALNLKLKDEYKGKISGNLEGSYGNKNNYLGHANLFRFNKMGNLAFVGDGNNIARDPISYSDFREMNRQEDVKYSTNISQIEIPSFLNNDGKVDSKANQFGALQYSKSSEKFSVAAFSVFNNVQLSKLLATNRTAFPTISTSFNFNEQRKEDNSGYFGTTQIKLKQSFRDNSFLYYNFGYNPIRDSFKQQINRSTDFTSELYTIENQTSNNSITNFLSWNKKINNINLILAFAQQNNYSSDDLHINSTSNLFNTPFKEIAQSLDIQTNNYNLDFDLKNNFKFADIAFHSGINISENRAYWSETSFGNNSTQSLKSYIYNNELFIRKVVGKFDFSGSVASNYMQLNNENEHFLSKNFRIKYRPESRITNDFSLEYSSHFQLPDFSQLLYVKNFDRNLTFTQNKDLLPETLSSTDTYKFSYLRFNLEKGNLLYFTLMYEKSKPNFTTNTLNFGLFSEIYNLTGNLKDRWLLIISDDRRFGLFSLKSKIIGLKTDSNNFINTLPNNLQLNNIEIGQKLSSNFKKFPVQFDFGYTLTETWYNQTLFDVSSTQESIKVSLGFRTNIKKTVIANVLGDYLMQKTPKNKRENFLLGGQVSYRKENSNIEFTLLFNNVLNLNSFQFISNMVSSQGIEESKISAMHGYIMGGMKWYF